MIDDVPRPRPQHLQKEKTRHGKTVWYVRKGDGKRTRIRGEFGTEDFQKQVDAAIAGTPAPQSKARTAVGSLQWLYDRYRETVVWRDLGAATRRQRENIFLHVMESAGSEPFTAITRNHIEAGKDRRRDTPAQARNFLDAMRGLFRWAFAAGHVAVDPTAGVKNPRRRKTEGFKAWTDAHVSVYERRWGPGTRQRVWLHVLLYIGCRRGDAVLLGRQHVKNSIVTFYTEKGRGTERELIEVARRLEPELVATLAQGPTSDLAFICGERGEPLTKESFGNMFKDACVAAGILDRSAHGLRKLAATTWAERGATEHELMALFGWLTPSMAALYTRAARRKMLSLNASARLLGTPAERAIPAPEGEVRESARKA